MLRRDKIIRELYANCPYKHGDIVRPVSDAIFAKEGLYRVDRICQSWYMYKGGVNDDKVEWSEKDNPKLVHVTSCEDGQSFECTTNYFIKFESEKK